MRTVGRIVKYLLYAIIFAVMIFLVWRAFFSDIMPKSVETLIITDELKAAYAENGNLTLKYQNLDMISRVQLSEKEEKEQDRFNNYGYFAITKVDIIPEADQIQIVFRYNNSTLRELAKDYSLPSVPDRTEELYDLSLVVATDLTPDDTSDNLSSDEKSVMSTRYFPTEAYTVSDEKNMYNYRKFVFEGIDLNDLNLAIYADIYYKGDINYERTAYGTLCIWDHLTEDRIRELTKDDIAALERK